MEDNEKFLEKRIAILSFLSPIMKSFEVYDYEYEIKDNIEYLNIGDYKINCNNKSIKNIINEAIEYLFFNIHCKNKDAKSFNTKNLDIIKKYWNK